MSWLGEGLSTLTSFTKEVLTESREEVNDHVAELTVARQKMRQLEGQYSAQKQEVERLRRANGECEEKIQVLELQLRNLASDYRSVLQQKQVRIEQLSLRLEELEEQNTKLAVAVVPPTSTYLSSPGTTTTTPFTGDAHDFDDVISCQREINRLATEVHRLRAERDATLSKLRATPLKSQDAGQQRVEDLDCLRAKVQELEAGHQRELSALEELHSRQVSVYEQELNRLRQWCERGTRDVSLHARSQRTEPPETQSEVVAESEDDGAQWEVAAGETAVSSDKSSDKCVQAGEDVEGDRGELERLHARLKELEVILALADAERTQNVKNRTDDHKEVAALQRQLGTLQDDHQRALGEAVAAQKRCSQLQEQVTSLTERLQNLDRHEGDTEADKERLVAVLNEKARENHGLRTEVHRLTGVVAKLQRHQNPPDGTQQPNSDPNNLQRMSRALREKDIEVQALSDKNRALLEVLRRTSPGQGEVGRTEELLVDKADLLRQKETLQNESAWHDELRHNYEALTLRFETQRKTLEESLQVETTLRSRIAGLEREIRENPPGEIARLRVETERLRDHLVRVEEGYTAEALEAERREEELRAKLAKAEERSKMEQVRNVTLQRDEALGQLSVREDEAAQLAASLRTLQVVLQQLQQEKERESSALRAKASADLAKEKRAITDLQREKRHLEERLAESAEALEAASRLSEQLDRKDEAIASLQQQVAFKESAASQALEELERVKGNVESVIDKTIVRNLLVGFFGVHAGQRQEVLRVMATVLDLSPGERAKVGLEAIVAVATTTAAGGGGGGGWLPNFLRRTPSTVSASSAIAVANKQPSLSEAFVRFLENESAPPQILKMPLQVMRNASRTRNATSNPSVPSHLPSSSSSSSSTNLLLMRPMATALPTFTPVADSSAGPNALRNVLQQN